MSWTFGRVTFPKPPNKVAFKSKLTSQKIPRFLEAPMLLHMGPDNKQISMEGEFFDNISPLSTIYSTYIEPIERYASTRMVIDLPLLGDAFGSGVTAQTSTWHEENTSMFKMTGNDQVQYEKSVRVRFDGGGLIYRDFDTNQDFKHHNFVSIWHKGDNDRSFQVTFYNEVESGKTNGYRFYFTTDQTWEQAFIAISTADYTSSIVNTVGSPTGWDKIRSIVIEPSTSSGTANDYWFDAMYVGQGWKLNAPGSRYDGIYTIMDWTIEEEGGNTRSLSWKLTLADKTQSFGDI